MAPKRSQRLTPAALAIANPLCADGKITFVEDGHKYTVFGHPIERSCTGVLGSFFPEREFLRGEWFQKWKTTPGHKYYRLIKQTLDAGGDDEAAKAAIRASWEAIGKEAARLGTAFHLHAEYDLNGEALPRSAEISKEIAQLEAFKASAWYTSRGLRPYAYRTELSVGFRSGDRSVSAGQIDALYIDKDDNYYLFDFKRVAKHHKLNPKDKGWAVGGEDPPVGLGPMAHLPDTPYQRYSLHTSIYNLMLLNTHGIDVEDRMYLLRVHTDRDAFEQVQCRDLCEEAKAALRAETERVMVQPRPPPPADHPAAASLPAGTPVGHLELRVALG